MAGDGRIDALQTEIEERAVKLLALRQPRRSICAKRWRRIKIAGELERIGDLAKNIAKRALVLNREPPIRLTQSLCPHGQARPMAQLKQVLDPFPAAMPRKPKNVWRRDGEIDEIYNSLFRELLTYMMEDPRTIGLCTPYCSFVAKNIERSGDHCTNIAEVVYHMVRAGHLATARPKADTHQRDVRSL